MAHGAADVAARHARCQQKGGRSMPDDVWKVASMLAARARMCASIMCTGAACTAGSSPEVTHALAALRCGPYGTARTPVQPFKPMLSLHAPGGHLYLLRVPANTNPWFLPNPRCTAEHVMSSWVREKPLGPCFPTHHHTHAHTAQAPRAALMPQLRA